MTLTTVYAALPLPLFLSSTRYPTIPCCAFGPRANELPRRMSPLIGRSLWVWSAGSCTREDSVKAMFHKQNLSARWQLVKRKIMMNQSQIKRPGSAIQQWNLKPLTYRPITMIRKQTWCSETAVNPVLRWSRDQMSPALKGGRIWPRLQCVFDIMPCLVWDDCQSFDPLRF